MQEKVNYEELERIKGLDEKIRSVLDMLSNWTGIQHSDSEKIKIAIEALNELLPLETDALIDEVLTRRGNDPLVHDSRLASQDTIEALRAELRATAKVVQVMEQIVALPEIIQAHDETEWTDEDKAADAERENIREMAQAAITEMKRTTEKRRDASHITLATARQAKLNLAKVLRSDSNVRGVGLVKVPDGYTIKVNVLRSNDTLVPHIFEGVPVRVFLVSPAVKLRKRSHIERELPL